MQPRFAVDVGLLDFRYTRELIATGYEQALDYFKRTAASACTAEPLDAAASLRRCE